MLAVISPAKTLDYQSKAHTKKFSQPEFLENSHKLIEQLNKKSSSDIATLMNISPDLVELNRARYQGWQTPFTPKNAKQAILAFKGDVYLGLEAWNLSQRDLTWTQNHLRILSGLYGLLKPLDLIQAYRLEMGTRLQTSGSQNLYQFWQNSLSEHLTNTLQANSHKVLVNLASREYFKVLDNGSLNVRTITPTFLDQKNGEYKFLSFFAKKARGLMVRYMIDERISSMKALKRFDRGGYRYCEQRSQGDNWVFIRDEAN